MSRSEVVRLAVVGTVLAVATVLVAAIVGIPGQSASQPPTDGGSVSAAAVSGPGDMAGTITKLQDHLRRVPGDAQSWASLGLAYVQQARVSGDPSYYNKAVGVFRRSLEVQPNANGPALTGQASLAAARHYFGRSLGFTIRAQRINQYDSVNLGVMVDALIELGRYPQAFRELQRMVDLKPGVPSYTRVSYGFELRGDLEGATYAMQRAVDIAYSPEDKAFALYQLGELAWNRGRIHEAARLYGEGQQTAPSYVPNLYGLAKTAAARGETRTALARYRELIGRLPLPQYVIEYSDYLTSLGRDEEAAQQSQLIDAQEQILSAAGVNLDFELALYDASHGREKESLVQARQAWGARQGVFVEDAYAWALHVNGHDRQALRHAVHSQRLGTKSALLAFHRGMIEKSLGMTKAARTSLRRALDINPHFSPLLAPEAQRTLDQFQSR